MGGMFVSTPRLFVPSKNSTWVTLPPSGSEAVAQMLILVGPKIIAPSRGLVMATRGGRLVTTEMSTTAEVTVLPARSLAIASRTQAPGGTLVQVRQKYEPIGRSESHPPRPKGLFIATPRTFVPARNSTLAMASVKYAATAQMWMSTGASSI